MNLKYIIAFFTLLLVFNIEGKRSGKSRSSGSGRGSSRKTNYNPQPAPTSFSYPQPSAPKPSIFGWQERPGQKSVPSTNNQGHSYPSSGTGLSGNKPKQPTTNQASHSYPQSTGLSGSSGNTHTQQAANKYPQQPNTGQSGNVGGNQHGYPQSPSTGLSGSGQPGSSNPQHHGSGLSGSGQAGYSYPQQVGQPGNGFSQLGSGHNGYPQAPPPYSGYRPGQTNYGGNPHPQGPPPPYTNVGSHYGGFGHGSSPNYGSQMPGYFGNYGKNNGGVSRTGSALTGVGIAGAGIGTVLTGLALWNLARSTGHNHHTVIYDNRGQPVAVAPANGTAPAFDSILADLVNCSLTISNDNKTEVLAIPCAIATSFTPEADVKDSGINENAKDNTKCTVNVLTKAGKEFMTTIPCSILLNTAAENNVTEPVIESSQQGNISNNTNEAAPLIGDGVINNKTNIEPSTLRLSGADTNVNTNLNCTPHLGETRDPINPCYAVNHDLTVIPLSTTSIPN